LIKINHYQFFFKQSIILGNIMISLS